MEISKNIMTLKINPFQRFKRKDATQSIEIQDLGAKQTEQLNSLSEGILALTSHLKTIFQLKIGGSSQRYKVIRESTEIKPNYLSAPSKPAKQEKITFNATGTKNSETPVEISLTYREVEKEADEEKCRDVIQLSYKYADQAHHNIFWAKAGPNKITLSTRS